MEDGGWRMDDGGWRMEDGGWRIEDGGWMMEGSSLIPIFAEQANLIRKQCLLQEFGDQLISMSTLVYR